MVIYENNALPFKKRIKEIIFDYLIILSYLVLLFCITMLIYIFSFNGIPEVDEPKAQWIALFTSVVPIILIFSYLDYSKEGSFGKRKAGLKLVYKRKTITSSLNRNGIKFLPWQIGHIGTIHGIYTNYDLLAIILSAISILFLLILFLMGFLRKDKRHLGDLLANTQVQIK